MNKFWNFLQEGDTIDIVAPSASVPTKDFVTYYQKIRDLFAKYGLVAQIPEDLINPKEDLFSANNIDYRVNHLINCINNSKSKAIWAIRGGYGAAKIIPYLEKISPPTTNKLLLGFSDITALHLFFENKWNFCTMHSAVINQTLQNEDLFQELLPIIFGQMKEISYSLTPLNTAATKKEIIKATITGGNLSIVQTSLATSWQINGNGKIIFLEDVGEEGYRVDRMLNHLMQAGVFLNAEAVVFGEITPPKAIENPLCKEAIENFAALIKLPVFSLPIVGHNIQNNSPLPLGSAAKIESIQDKATLTCYLK